MPGTDTRQVALPFPTLTPRTCHATCQGPRGEENLRAGRTLSSEARRRSAGDLDISQGHTASKAPGTPKSSRVQRPRPARTRGSGSAVPGHQSSSAAGVGRCWKRSRTPTSSPQEGRRCPGGAAGSSATSVRAKWRGAGTEGEKATLRPPPSLAPALPSPARRRRARAVRRGRRLPVRGSAHPRAFRGAALTCPRRQSGATWRRLKPGATLTAQPRPARPPRQPRGPSSAEPQVTHPAGSPGLRIRPSAIFLAVGVARRYERSCSWNRYRKTQAHSSGGRGEAASAPLRNRDNAAQRLCPREDAAAQHSAVQTFFRLWKPAVQRRGSGRLATATAALTLLFQRFCLRLTFVGSFLFFYPFLGHLCFPQHLLSCMEQFSGL